MGGARHLSIFLTPFEMCPSSGVSSIQCFTNLRDLTIPREWKSGASACGMPNINGKGGYVTGQVPVQYHDVEAGLALAGAGSWRQSLIDNY